MSAAAPAAGRAAAAALQAGKRHGEAAPSSKRAAAVPVLQVKGISCGYGSQAVLRDVSFSLSEGGMLVLLGPNGVGKTTLFKTILGFLPRLGGQVLIDGEDTARWPRRRFAQAVAYVPQTHDAAFGFAVRDMVLMGRTPGLEGLRSPDREDERIADEVISRMGLARLADRDCTTLSGGELQMVLVARALAQQPRLLIMDEPCANLDLGNQALLLHRVAELASQGLAVVVTSHDPNHAFLLDAEVACVGRDGQVRGGRAGDVLTPGELGRLYGVDVGVGSITGPRGKRVSVCAPFLEGERIEHGL